MKYLVGYNYVSDHKLDLRAGQCIVELERSSWPLTESQLRELLARVGSLNQLQAFTIVNIMPLAGPPDSAVEKESPVRVGQGYTSDTSYERCKRCNRHYTHVWSASDTLWQKIVGDYLGCYCPECFTTMCLEKGITPHWYCQTGDEAEDECQRRKESPVKVWPSPVKVWPAATEATEGGFEARVQKALAIAMRSGGVDGGHHKMWVIDQMVRALTGCPIVTKIVMRPNGSNYEYQTQGESQEYLDWVVEHNDGEDGPETYEWEKGIAP